MAKLNPIWLYRMTPVEALVNTVNTGGNGQMITFTKLLKFSKRLINKLTK